MISFNGSIGRAQKVKIEPHVPLGVFSVGDGIHEHFKCTSSILINQSVYDRHHLYEPIDRYILRNHGHSINLLATFPKINEIAHILQNHLNFTFQANYPPQFYRFNQKGVYI